jgi:excinuclease ABC subunit C
MRDRRGVIIYVGKAKNLKSRVSQYFRQGSRHAPKVRSMVNTVWDFEFLVVRNEAEALLTESNLIKKHKPRFNILMRDDKRYLALRADPFENWPRFSCCRVIKNDKARYFGPFPSSQVVRLAKDFVEKRWALRSCSFSELNKDCQKHCNANVIRMCSAPCLGKIGKEEYLNKFEEACEFLRGGKGEVIEELVSKMKQEGVDGRYESAAKTRDLIAALTQMRKSHYVRNEPTLDKERICRGLEELAQAIGMEKPPRIIECVDISNLFGTNSVASLVVARDGMPDKRYYRRFKIKTIIGADDPRSMREVVMRRFTDENIRLEKPDLLICDGGIVQLEYTRQALDELGILDVPTVALAEKQEEIVLGDGRENIFLPRDSEALFICTRLRDEAHRFAISYHRSLRDKSLKQSVLDGIAGIGEKRKFQLLNHFKTIDGIRKASVEEIMSVCSLSKKNAANILEILAK